MRERMQGVFVGVDTAARIDRAEARLSTAVAEAIRGVDVSVTAIGGGAAVCARPGSPVNKLIGAGFDGPLSATVLAAIEADWQARGEPVRVELASLAAAGVAEQLAGRGYRLVGFENVLVRALAAVPAADPAIRIDQDEAAWLRVLVEGFAAGDGTGVLVDVYAREAIEAVMRDVAGAAGFARYVAWLDGEAVGAATMRVDDGVALLCGAATLPAARRRGVQAALLAVRLGDARAAGCELAAITTAPGSLSQRNAARQEFALAYVRAILVRGA